MNNRLLKKLNIGVLSLSTILLLAACGDTGTTEDPATDTDIETEGPTTDPAEEPAGDPQISPEEEEDASDEAS